ncbi:MAG TPA: hypothetical protein VMW69_04835 [Spirochaetia bacterium]|nr:hypothetical protein [Spirochaetia bacterium]
MELKSVKALNGVMKVKRVTYFELSRIPEEYLLHFGGPPGL